MPCQWPKKYNYKPSKISELATTKRVSKAAEPDKTASYSRKKAQKFPIPLTVGKEFIVGSNNPVTLWKCKD